MSKVKKVLAIILSMAMVLGMSLTAFAAPTGTTIVVNNLDGEASLTAVQVIEPDTTKETGWKFSSTDAAEAYATAFEKESYTEDDLQDIIWSLILFKTNDESKVPAGTVKATADQIKNALAGLDDASYTNAGANFIVATGGVEVTTAGVYAIKATTTDSTYVYSDMAAYVSFDKYVNGEPTELSADPVNAKKTTLEVTKESDEDDDKVVAVGDVVEYTIKVTIPYVDETLNEYTFTLTDTLTDADYILNVDGSLKLTECTLGGEDYNNLVINPSGRTFEVDLSEIALDRSNANKELVFKYEAEVKGLVINNKVEMDNGDHEYNTENEIYTAKATIIKTDVEDEQTLANAEFKLYRESDGKYAIVKADESVADTYIVTGWGTKEEATVNIKTGASGTAVVKGLDDSDVYYFEEVVAPDGYSINETDSPVKWEDAENPETANDRNGTATMTDTKLSSLPLPSTGGMGTTIFTIGGCVIMIAAAGLYFASRRKENK